ncbi:hypothetical protein CALCODRAFT_540810, partial [Calocera cornea HHB12733]
EDDDYSDKKENTAAPTADSLTDDETEGNTHESEDERPDTDDNDLDSELVSQLSTAEYHKRVNNFFSVSAIARVKIQRSISQFCRAWALVNDPFPDPQTLSVLAVQLAEGQRLREGFGPTPLSIYLFDALPKAISQDLKGLRAHISKSAYEVIARTWPQLVSCQHGSPAERRIATVIASTHLDILLESDNFLREGFDPSYPALTSGILFGSRLLLDVMIQSAFQPTGMGSSAILHPDYFSPVPVAFIAFIASMVGQPELLKIWRAALTVSQIALTLVGLREGRPATDALESSQISTYFLRYKAQLQDLPRKKAKVVKDLRKRISAQCLLPHRCYAVPIDHYLPDICTLQSALLMEWNPDRIPKHGHVPYYDADVGSLPSTSDVLPLIQSLSPFAQES